MVEEVRYEHEKDKMQYFLCSKANDLTYLVGRLCSPASLLEVSLQNDNQTDVYIEYFPLLMWAVAAY